MLERHVCAGRTGWYELVKTEYGLVYIDSEDPSTGRIFSYWAETGYYTLPESDRKRLQQATATIQAMMVEAGDYVIQHKLYHRFGIPDWAVPAIELTWQDDLPNYYWPSVFGRFDIAFDGRDIKLLEYNADTPTSLPESTGVQWEWHQYNSDLGGIGNGQWNGVFECLVEAWKRNVQVYEERTGRKVRTIHFAYTADDESGEDMTNATWMAAAAKEAGFGIKIITMESIRIIGHDGEFSFLDAKTSAATGEFIDADGEPIDMLFKLYPWEWMLHDGFGKTAVWNMLRAKRPTVWVEPIYKMLWSNKAILPILWKLFGNDPIRGRYLLPAYFEGEEPAGFRDGSYVRKPILGREGASVAVFIDGELAEANDGKYGAEGYVLQQLFRLPKFDSPEDPEGVYPILGIWMVDNDPDGGCGMGIRESTSLITNNLSRFVPHKIVRN